jgi:mono/diheme cytochrome c family protein
MAHGKHSGTGLYITVAIILAVITYLEYAIVEFPPTWLSSGWILFFVVAMSVVKFWMVIWFFMHLRDDPKIYTGFFSSGMVIGLGTFVVLIAMFILPRAVAPVMMPGVMVSDVAHAPYGAAALSDEQRALIESDGASRPQAQRSQTPRPRDGSLVVTPPAASVDGFALRSDEIETASAEAVDPAAADEPVAEADEPIVAEAPDAIEFDTELGASTYLACSGCHQASGAGIPGAFPPLAGHAADLYRADGGRSYLIGVMLYGVQGQIVVDGTTYNGVMPAFPHYDDDAIAAVLNHIVTEWGNAERIGAFDAFTAAEVEAERGQGLTAADMYELRQELVFASDAAEDTEPEPEPDADTVAPDAEAAAEPEADEADAAEPEAAPSSADPTFDTALGASTYANCVGCHQPTGAGIPGAFPPLVGHSADLFNAEGGRTYLIEMMLYGVQGQIVVDGATYNGVMPGWQQLSDDAIAAVINHTLTEWGNADLIDDFDAIRAAEVEAARGQGLSASDMYGRRGALGLD